MNQASVNQLGVNKKKHIMEMMRKASIQMSDKIRSELKKFPALFFSGAMPHNVPHVQNETKPSSTVFHICLVAHAPKSDRTYAAAPQLQVNPVDVTVKQ